MKLFTPIEIASLILLASSSVELGMTLERILCGQERRFPRIHGDNTAVSADHASMRSAGHRLSRMSPVGYPGEGVTKDEDARLGLAR